MDSIRNYNDCTFVFEKHSRFDRHDREGGGGKEREMLSTFRNVCRKVADIKKQIKHVNKHIVEITTIHELNFLSKNMITEWVCGSSFLSVSFFLCVTVFLFFTKKKPLYYGRQQ